MKRLIFIIFIFLGLNSQAQNTMFFGHNKINGSTFEMSAEHIRVGLGIETTLTVNRVLGEQTGVIRVVGENTDGTGGEITRDFNFSTPQTESVSFNYNESTVDLSAFVITFTATVVPEGMTVINSPLNHSVEAD